MVDIVRINGCIVEDGAGAALQAMDDVRKRTPPTEHEIMESMGIPWNARLHAPIRDQLALREVADILSGLSVRLRGISHNKSLNNQQAAIEAWAAIRESNRSLERLADRRYGKARARIELKKANLDLYPDENQGLKDRFNGTKSSGSGEGVR